MTSYIPADIRRLVVDRASSRCEYCLIRESDTFCGCQIDHIIAEKHDGQTIESNLAFTCAYCNRFKGSDVGSIAKSNGEFTRFFNPRIDVWAEHFDWANYTIVPLTPIGETTCRILQLNEPDRILEREAIGQPGNA
jgi:hypothetical protein